MDSEISVNITVHEHPYWQSKGDWVLCYVDGQWAYFTESLDGQWGDDWNDAPYEHNAGRPYGVYGSDDDHPDAFAVVLATELEAPSYNLGRSVSVQQINEGDIPWMALPDFMSEDVELYAGDTYQEVVSTIEEHSGAVYVPRKPKK